MTRSSAAPRITVVPLAVAASAINSGNSSITSGTHSAGISSPCSAPAPWTASDATGSAPAPASPATIWRDTRPGAIRSITRRNPSRVGLVPTGPISILEPFTSRAAATRKAAEDRSPGTRTWVPRSDAGPVIAIRPACTMGRTPNAGSSRSVWSRDGAGSKSPVSPSACRPARRIADLTCALAIFKRCSCATSNRGRTTSGQCPFRLSILAPIRSSGSITRPIGRRDSDSSPTSVIRQPNRSGCPASAPVSKRIPVPELPRSRAWSGACRPRPSIETRSPLRLTAAPSSAIAFSVARVSSAGRKPSIRVEPRARPPSRAARCEIDLSPGGRTAPLSGADAG